MEILLDIDEAGKLGCDNKSRLCCVLFRFVARSEKNVERAFCFLEG